MSFFDLSRLGSWRELAFFEDVLPDLQCKLEVEDQTILPPAGQVFAALEATPPQDVRVVILGQDPYPTPGHAHGFAFSATADTKPLPRSLTNIFREMRDDLGACPANADLRFWSAQGDLLLNTSLTVSAQSAGSHDRIGWHVLTHQVLTHLASTPRAYLLCGAHAQMSAQQVDPSLNLKIETAHPSPLSAHRGFFGSRPFSRVNAWLQEKGHPVINWAHAWEGS